MFKQDQFYDLKSVIANETLKKPTVFPNFSLLSSLPFCSMTVDKCADILKSKQLKFRIGKREPSNDVQWEGNCQFVLATLKDFICWLDGKNDCGAFVQFDKETHWAYADYMYAKDVFSETPEYDILEKMSWSNLGFTDTEGNDMALWIGSKAAHTVCHYDTYGYNVVIQIFGRKRWTLFPPDDMEFMYPTRIPYEESTVFSKVNILNPDLAKYPKFSNSHPHVVTLNAGDLLFVPPRWWHFVENLETSMSANAWFPHEYDKEQRINEAITRLLVSAGIAYENTDSLFNPSLWVNPTEERVTERKENLKFLSNALKSHEITGDNNKKRTEPNKSEACSCWSGASLPLEADCREVPQLCFNHACVKIENWKHLQDMKDAGRDDMLNFFGVNAKKRSRLFKEQDVTLKKFVEIITKPNVVNFIRQELAKDSATI